MRRVEVPDFLRHVGDWLPLLIVIGFGVLAGVKKWLDDKRARPGGDAAEKPKAHPIFEEVRKYLDTYEGRDDDKEDEDTENEEEHGAPTETREAPPPRKPALAGEPEPAAPPAAEAAWAALRTPAIAADEPQPMPSHLRHPIGSGHAPLSRTVSPRPQRHRRLGRAELRRALVWREILGPPTALREPRSEERDY